MLVKILLVISIIFLPSVSRAESDYNNIVQFKITSLQLFSSFSSFIYFQGDDKNRKRLLTAKAQADAAVSTLSGSSVELKLKWQQISDYIESYQAHNFDGSNMSLEAGWSILQGELNNIISMLETHSISLSGAVVPLKIDNIRIKMETILSRYMVYANSTTGGYGVSYGETPLEEEIMTMKQELTELAQTETKYRSLLKKWNYIESTLLAYNSNIAPFVVLHTFDRMRKMIASY